jgi:multidrug efflux pump subunit AcrB
MSTRERVRVMLEWLGRRQTIALPINSVVGCLIATILLMILSENNVRTRPAIDGGQIQLHVRAPAGTRIEVTERVFQAVDDKIREIIPASERELIVDSWKRGEEFPKELVTLPGETYRNSALVTACYALLAPKSAALQ